MADRKMTEDRSTLRMSWVPVRDAQGRVRMQARWAATPVVPRARQAA
ncbi:hypothetical protein [Nocardioides solisilvae]|nr:hypothetical protein [Nocardioides solisilvae]